MRRLFLFYPKRTLQILNGGGIIYVMEPEQPTRNKKPFVVLTVVLIFLAFALFLLTKKVEAPEPQSGAPSKVVETPPRVYTEAEKMDILKNIATQSSKDTTTQAQDIKTLQNLSKQAPRDTTSTEDKLKILQALSTQTN